MSTSFYRNRFDLRGRGAIVTGALGILGQRFCAGLAEFGANVAVVDLDENQAVALATKLAFEYGVKTIGIRCDVASPESVESMTARADDAIGPIRILHNNAASKSDDLEAFFASYEQYSFDEWRKVMAVNLDGMFLVSQAVGRRMVEQEVGGSIIQTASIYGIVAPDQRIYEGSHYLGRRINTPAVYAASKAGVIGLTRYLCTYWAGNNIRVNALIPGGVESGQNAEFIRRYSDRVPLGRMADRDELVGALVFLASDASSYITGQSLVVDGGLSAW